MTRWIQLPLALMTAVALVGCAGDDNRAQDTARDNPGAVGTAGAGAPDADFIEEQLVDGNAEVELGRLAQEKGTNPQVREFGEMMVQDHTQAGSELKQIASKHNIDMPPPADRDEHNALQERLRKATGAEFDREYINAMVDEHEKAVSDVEDKAEGSDNPEVKQWAAKTLPTLKQHLERAKQLQETLEKSGTR
jgi:putative membrane protein